MKKHPLFTGWELNLDKNLLIKKDIIYKALYHFYPLIGINSDESIIAIIRKSDTKKYRKPDGPDFLMLLTIYTSSTWRHFYLPNNEDYTGIEVLDRHIYIKTARVIKVTTFAELNRYPIFIDQTEENRRLLFECLSDAKEIIN